MEVLNVMLRGILKDMIVGVLIGVVGFSITSNIKGSKAQEEVITPKQVVEVSKEVEDLKTLAREVLPYEDKARVDILYIDIVKGELEDKYTYILEDNENSEFDNTLGFHDVSRDLIALETNDEDMRATFLHELGHFVDKTYISGEVGFKYSNSKEFVKAFESEAITLYGEGAYPTTNVVEYFAQAFGDYVNKIDYSRLAPLTYKYIEGLF